MDDGVRRGEHDACCDCCRTCFAARRQSRARLRAEAAALLVQVNDSLGVDTDPRWVQLARRAGR